MSVGRGEEDKCGEGGECWEVLGGVGMERTGVLYVA